MNSTRFNNKGYLVSKTDGGSQLFLSRNQSSSGDKGAIGQGGTTWTPEPTADSIFSSQDEGSRLAKQHGGNLIPVNLTMEVQEEVSA